MVRSRREGVLVRARDVVARRHILRSYTHAHDAVACFFDRRVFEFRPQLRRDRAAAVVACHALHAASNADINLSDSNGIGNVGYRAESRGACSVCGAEGCGRGYADVVGGHATSF